MIPVFYDTEFTELTLHARLISIGLVDLSGTRTFYAELTGHYTEQECAEFTRQHVLRHLEGGLCAVPLADLRDRLAAWLNGLGGEAELLSDSIWDRYVLQQIFPSYQDWPEKLGNVGLIGEEWLSDRRYRQGKETAYASGLRCHHALDDALAIRQGLLAARWKQQAPR